MVLFEFIEFELPVIYCVVIFCNVRLFEQHCYFGESLIKTRSLDFCLCRLTHNAKGHIVSGGFLSPTDADSIDLSLWMPMLPIVDPQIDIAMAKYIIKNVGNRFCELVEQEKEAMSWVSSNSKNTSPH